MLLKKYMNENDQNENQFIGMFCIQRNQAKLKDITSLNKFSVTSFVFFFNQSKWDYCEYTWMTDKIEMEIKDHEKWFQ